MQTNYLLTSHNTFHVPAVARWFERFTHKKPLVDFLSSKFKKYPRTLILGGGSNILFCRDFDGLVLHVDIKGKSIEHEDDKSVHLRVMAGEDWDQLVAFAVGQTWGGLENLSLIPGRAGASPIQNIGAYGAEVKDVILEVEFYSLEDQKIYRIKPDECKFGYRNSIFKNELKGKVVILSVLFRLSKKHRLNYHYKTLEQALENENEINIQTIRNAVIKVRRTRLPDTGALGNAGSFFKNPVVAANIYHDLKKEWKDIPGYDAGERLIKIPAAYLIEKCNWKGKRLGNVGVYEHQPLVLVNHGGASGKEVMQLAGKIKDSVKSKFDIHLETEVNLIE